MDLRDRSRGDAPVANIRTIETADDVFGAWFAAFDAAHRHDFPDGPHWLEHELRVRHTPNMEIDTCLLIASDEAGGVVGSAVAFFPLTDNLAMAQIDVAVVPGARRRGIGSALLEAAEAEARRRGRTRFMADIEGPPGPYETPGTHFAEHHGYTRRIIEILRAQRLPIDTARLDELEQAARPHAVGYEIVTWRDRVPDAYVDEYARLMARMSTDAPLGELDYEPEVWDAARVQEHDDRIARMRRGSWGAGAMTPDGTMAGLTEIVLSHDSDEVAFQDETIVDPPHRGHRLGLMVKIANLRRLLHDRPGVQSVWTGNADTNSFMISVNEKLGYEVAGWLAGYQRDV